MDNTKTDKTLNEDLIKELEKIQKTYEIISIHTDEAKLEDIFCPDYKRKPIMVLHRILALLRKDFIWASTNKKQLMYASSFFVIVFFAFLGINNFSPVNELAPINRSIWFFVLILFLVVIFKLS